jgi:transcriptional regulator with XRE-family HTH domain
MTHSKLQTKRLEAQMSQSQLATAAGINGRMLQYYEQGAKDLSGAKLATLLKLCLALNCTLADILPDGETTELLPRYGHKSLFGRGVHPPAAFLYSEEGIT